MSIEESDKDYIPGVTVNKFKERENMIKSFFVIGALIAVLIFIYKKGQ